MSLRLFDAVVVAAIALLGLKVIGFWGPVPHQSLQTEPAGKVFARVLAKPRDGFAFRDPEVTGTVDAAKAEEKKPEEKKGEQRAEASSGMKSAASLGPGPLPGGRQVGGKQVSLEAGQSGQTASERELFESLGERRDELEARARELDMREKLLETAQKKLEARLGELKALEGKVTAGDRRKADAEEQTAKNLVIMYETMKPKDAARVFDKLGHDVLVPVVVQMNARKMSEILAAMTPEVAQRLTNALAARAKINAGNTETRSDAGLPAGELAAVEAAPPAKKP